MGRLGIDLQEGFLNDTVVITVNGRESYRNPKVSTRNQIGLAAQVELDVANGPAVVEIVVPSKGARHRVEVDGAQPPNLGVSLGPGGDLRCHQQSGPFGYV